MPYILSCWDDLLRVAGSLKNGWVPPRYLWPGCRPPLARTS